MVRKCYALSAFAWMAVTFAWAAPSPTKLSEPGLEARAVKLQKTFRCVVCQGESLDESSAPLAADLRALIRLHIQKGDTDAQIEQYLVARYGDFILMKPPLGLETYVLWFGPLVVLMMGGAGAAVVMVHARRRVCEDSRLSQTQTSQP